MTSRALDWLSLPIANWSLPHRRVVLWTIILSQFLFFVVLAYSYGPTMTIDGRRDHAMAVALVESGFDLDSEAVSVVRRDFDLMQPPVQYLLYYAVLGATHIVAGEYWFYLLVFANVIAQAFVSGALLYLVADLFQTRAALFGMGIMTMGCWEYLQWIQFSQSDTLFGALVLVTFLLTYRQWVAPSLKERARWAILLSLFTLASAFFRPAAVPLVGFVTVTIFLGFYLRGRHIADRARALDRWVPWLIAGLLVATPLLVLPMFDSSILPEGGIRDSFSLYHRHAAAGMVVLARPEYAIPAPEGYAGYLLIALIRLLYFFLFVANDLSTLHNVVNIFFFVPLYLFAGFGIWFIFWRPNLVAPQVRIIGLFAIGIVVLFDAFHAVTLLDFDWRYRAPTYPALFLLTTIGIEKFVVELGDKVSDKEAVTT